MKKAEREHLNADSGCEEILTALNALPTDVLALCSLMNEETLVVPDIEALPPNLLTAMGEQEQCSGAVAAYQATVNQRLASSSAPIERSLWINQHKQGPDEIRMLLLLILLQEGMIGDDATRNELELWAMGYLRHHFHRLSNAAAYEVLHRLQQRFVFPEDWRAFRSYTKQIVRGVLAEARKGQVGGEHVRTGDRLIPQVAARLEAEGLAISAQTVYRWQAAGTLCGQHLEELLVQARTIVQPKHRRAQLFAEGKKRGMSKDNLKKLFQRKKNPDGTPDFEAIEARINRPNRVTETTMVSEDAMSLEAQRVAWEERRAEAPLGSDAWCEAQDALQRLQQSRPGTHP
jgi:hypothetical protein